MNKNYPIRASSVVSGMTGIKAYRLNSTGIYIWKTDGTSCKILKAKMPPLENLSFFTLADCVKDGILLPSSFHYQALNLTTPTEKTR